MTELNFEQARFNMVEQQIRTWDVLDQRVLDAIQDTPRERFVPAEYRNLAYADINVPLGEGEMMMKPILEARMLQELNIDPQDTILEIGTGSGYVTALLARLGWHVYSVDINPAFVKQAGERLTAMGISNVTLAQGDAASGWPQNAPYNIIACTSSYPVDVPINCLRNLKIGGRMFAIIGEAPAMSATLITRISEDEWQRETLFETEQAPLRNVATPQRFVL